MFVLGGACVAAVILALSGHGRPPSEPVTVPAHALNVSEAASPRRVTTDPAPLASTVLDGPAPVPATSLATSTGQVAALPPSAVGNLRIPVVGVTADELVDTFTDARSQGRVHDAIDIMAARGTPVVAVNDGHVVKLFTSVRGGLTVYQFDPQDQVIYYYAHLEGYAPGLVEGQLLHRGDAIGRVGSTGNASAEAPHLHFEVEILGPKKRWWHATSINPYGRFAGQP